jgi:hypothetical protein
MESNSPYHTKLTMVSSLCYHGHVRYKQILLHTTACPILPQHFFSFDKLEFKIDCRINIIQQFCFVLDYQGWLNNTMMDDWSQS